MSTIINGTSSAITFPDSSVQNTSAIVSGYVPYANLPAGSVLQVVNATYSTQVSSSSQSYSDTGLTATITPKFSTSKIFVLISHPSCVRTNGNANNDLTLNLCKNGSEIVQWTYALGWTQSTLPQYFSASFNYLDSPATTSATTYKTQFKNHDTPNAAVIVQNNNIISTITLMEIAA
jgi:hypothetical protein